MEDMKLAVAVLQDTTQMASWRNVAWYLGQLGFPECFEPLRDFIWGAHRHGDRGRVIFDALHSAQASMGPVAASSPQAMRYLIQSTAPSFWSSLPWDESQMTRREFRVAMSEASIEALGMSGTSEAGQMLARLRQSPYAEAQRATIEKALRMHHRIDLERGFHSTSPRWSTLYHLPEMLGPNRDRGASPAGGKLRPRNDDGIPLFGAWRWMRSTGAWGAYETPPACGWSRVLFFDRDSTYSFWETDSVGAYRIRGGRFVVHPSVHWPGRSWIELSGWSSQGPGTFWPKFMGPDLLRLDPGGRDVIMRDSGLTQTFVREREQVAPPDTARARKWRPARVCRATPTSYYIEIPEALRRRLGGMRIRQWDLSHSRRLVPRCYRYTNHQIPSGVIGDFDGDSLADAAVYGYDGSERGRIVCLLSNRGSPIVATAWLEPGAGRRQGGPSRPAFYLELCPAGGSVVDSSGARMVLAADGIRTTSHTGEESIFYYADGRFHRGKPSPVAGGRSEECK